MDFELWTLHNLWYQGGPEAFRCPEPPVSWNEGQNSNLESCLSGDSEFAIDLPSITVRQLAHGYSLPNRALNAEA